MQHRLLLFALTLGLFAAAGCGTVNHMQYQLNGRTSPTGNVAGITAADRDALKEILRASAERLNLEERTEASLIPGTIVYYLTPDTDTPVKLLAWTHNNHIMVDLIHSPGAPGESLDYQAEKDQLWNALEREFAGRVTIVPRNSHMVPGQAAAPPNPSRR